MDRLSRAVAGPRSRGNTVPVFSAALAWIVFHERLRARVAAGIVLSMLGVGLIAQAENPSGQGTVMGSGAALVLLAATPTGQW